MSVIKQLGHRWIGAVPFALWLVSLVAPTAGWGNDLVPAPGYAILFTGWAAIVEGQFGWLANLYFFASVPIGFGSKKPWRWIGLALSAMITMTAAQALEWREVHVPGRYYPVRFGPGYHIWLVAMFGQAIWLVGNARPWSLFKTP